MIPFQGERVNIHGLTKEDWSYFNNNNNKLNCTHEDLNQVLTMLGVKKFSRRSLSRRFRTYLCAFVSLRDIAGVGAMSIHGFSTSFLQCVLLG